MTYSLNVSCVFLTWYAFIRFFIAHFRPLYLLLFYHIFFSVRITMQHQLLCIHIPKSETKSCKKLQKHLLCVYHKPYSNSNYHSQTHIFCFAFTLFCSSSHGLRNVYISVKANEWRVFVCPYNRWSIEAFLKFNNKISLICWGNENAIKNYVNW